MIAFINNSHDPYYNLSLEEYCLRYRNEDFFILWRNSPTVVVGKNQNVYEEVNLSELKKRGINLIRRITGGGAVYHDLGNINYTFITSKDKVKSLDFKYFTEPIIEALKELGVEAHLSGRNDLLVGDRKFSGNAQYSTDTRVLHHGTLLFNSDLTVLSSVLNPDKEKYTSKSLKSVKSRVCNLSDYLSVKITPVEFMEKIISFVTNKYNCETMVIAPEDEKFSEIINREKDIDFICGKHISFSYKFKKRFSFGNVEIMLNIKKGVITEAKIHGDFFSLSEVTELENKLIGANFNYESIKSRIAELIPSAIYGMTADEFLDLIFSNE